MKSKFLKRLAADSALALFEHLPDTYFFAKDQDGRFVAANASFIRGCGLAGEGQLLGKTDLDVWPRHLAEEYRRDDRWILAHGEPIVNKLELSRNSRGGTDWFSTTKVPLLDRRGNVRGVAGFARDVKKGHTSFHPYREMAAVMEYIMSNYASTLSLKTLAGMAAMSPSRFERRFKRIFGRPPTDYIRSIRIQAACQLLADDALSVTEIAYRTGFYDHSHFNRVFSKEVGLSPTRYRNTHAASAPASRRNAV